MGKKGNRPARPGVLRATLFRTSNLFFNYFGNGGILFREIMYIMRHGGTKNNNTYVPERMLAALNSRDKHSNFDYRPRDSYRAQAYHPCRPPPGPSLDADIPLHICVMDRLPSRHGPESCCFGGQHGDAIHTHQGLSKDIQHQRKQRNLENITGIRRSGDVPESEGTHIIPLACTLCW
jgi:hypothetical protein